MRILVVNPNSTGSMTAKIAAAARRVARPDTQIVATNPADSPPSIQGFLDAALCVPGLLDEVRRARDYDAVVVACFDDTGVDALRCVVDVPVIGIGEAAYHAAAMVSTKFSVVTTLSRSVAGLEANLLRYGLDRRCGRVRASDVPVLKLEEGDETTIDRIRREIEAAITEDGAEAIVLGCAGMTDLMSRLSEEFQVPVIDGVTCGVTMAEALVASGLKTSKKRTYSLA
ncbi:aspartate/glutamate racemase family protein [Roseibium salinum]|uniref:Aspartate/glutamate racemase family protein n=1 Tax=Roseibium salinum TaxID=1604349 RepID=A0ABT3QVX4_9HYPH|nr:aspartate/glutamate racemase family protein [Roseibium sp. DSM 29163]MCX2721083.1 aspartate/glutamate racemase family protein [Roseibium sp. DSM 29163]MDN3722546.1 aspartate/glutamate racemase family protein [Roseibium salinum]